MWEWKISKRLNIPLSTVRAIIKKFKRYGTVENLMGRGRNCILSPRILRRMVREETKYPRITVKELPWCFLKQDATIRRHLHNHSLIGRAARRKPFLTTRHRSHIYIMTRTRCSGQMKPKLNVFVRYSIGMFGIGTEMHTRRSTSYPR